MSLPVLVTSPAAEAADAAGPTEHFLPPRRVQDTHALGGMDVVKDVYALDAAGKRTSGGVRALIGSTDGSSSLESVGRREFDGTLDNAWTGVGNDVLAHLTMGSLQANLKAMMVGTGIELPSHGVGASSGSPPGSSG